MSLNKLLIISVFCVSAFPLSRAIDKNNDETQIAKVIDKYTELVIYQKGVFLHTVSLEDISGDRLFILVDINVCSICREELMDYLKSRKDKTKQITLLFSGYIANPRFLHFIDTRGYDKYLIKSLNIDNYSNSDVFLFVINDETCQVEKHFTYTKDNCALEHFLSELGD